MDLWNYLRKDVQGNTVLDYDMLDMSARANFNQLINLWADSIEIDFESEPDASNGERVLAIEDTVNYHVRIQYQLLEDTTDDSIQIDDFTTQYVKERLVRALSEKYDVTL